MSCGVLRALGTLSVVEGVPMKLLLVVHAICN